MQETLVPDWRNYILGPPSILTEESWTTRNALVDRYYPHIYDLLRFSEERLIDILFEVDQDEKPPAEFPVGGAGSPRPLAWLPKRSHLEWHLFRGIAPAAKRAAIPRHVRVRVIERDQGVCGICNEPVDPGDIHLDHIKPWSLGGPDTVDNLRVTHSLCNIKRGAPAEWHASE